MDVDTAEDVQVLRLAGVIDMATLPLVRTAIAAASDHRPARLVVDLSEISFCSARGFGELADGATAAPGYTVTGTGPHLDRIASLSRTDRRHQT